MDALADMLADKLNSDSYKSISNFEYTWEINRPVVKQKYGHYVLPMLYEERFTGRVETVCER